MFGIMFATMDTFSVWLLNEMEKRGWNQAELHRRSGMSRSIISDVISESANPGWEFCANIARAFNMPPEQVMSVAGLVPKVDPDRAETRRLVYLFDQLHKDDKITILQMMEFLLSK